MLEVVHAPALPWALPCALAYLLDLGLGDPAWLPHPVRAIGWLIRRLEGHLYPAGRRRFTGVVLVIATVGITVGAVIGVLALAAHAGDAVAKGTAIVLLWMAFSTHDLIGHGSAVRRALQVGDLAAARRALARMVSRDTHGLEAAAVARACIESLAENLTDGSLSPFLFGVLGGPAAAWGLKAVSTLDSMVGYRNARYREFGWAAARCDDVAHYVPARLLWILLPLASWCTGASGRECFLVMRRDGHKTASPNAGLPEAGVAGALGLEMGGPSSYDGVVVRKARLNAGGRQPRADDIGRTQRLVWAASLLPVLAALPWGWR